MPDEYRVKSFRRFHTKPIEVSTEQFEKTVKEEIAKCNDYAEAFSFFLKAEQNLFCAYAVHRIDLVTYDRCKEIIDRALEGLSSEQEEW